MPDDSFIRNFEVTGDRKIAPRKIAPENISPRVRVWGWFRVKVGGNLPGGNLPRGVFPSTVNFDELKTNSKQCFYYGTSITQDFLNLGQ